MQRNEKQGALLKKRRQKLIILITIIICIAAMITCLQLRLFTGTKELNPSSSQESSKFIISSSQNQSSSQPDRVSLQDAKKPLWVKVAISDQNVTVYASDDRIVESFICSTGKKGDDTPVGTFTVKEKGQSFFSKTYQEGAYYWTQFYGDFLFHSVPFDKNRTIETVEAAKLGSKASHGCIRLSIDNAKWIYDHIPRGTKVVIE
jgi:lipoprotein-anchoring transpeptidase ErfK/SrfK